MAQVAAAVANGGELTESHLTDAVIDADGREVERLEPERQSRIMFSDTAAKGLAMMTNVVQEGSGTVAALQGIQVAGRTGTAEKNIARRLSQAWFIGIAPADDPQLVAAATVEDDIGGQGAGAPAAWSRRPWPARCSRRGSVEGDAARRGDQSGRRCGLRSQPAPASPPVGGAGISANVGAPPPPTGLFATAPPTWPAAKPVTNGRDRLLLHHAGVLLDALTDHLGAGVAVDVPPALLEHARLTF